MNEGERKLRNTKQEKRWSEKKYIVIMIHNRNKNVLCLSLSTTLLDRALMRFFSLNLKLRRYIWQRGRERDFFPPPCLFNKSRRWQIFNLPEVEFNEFLFSGRIKFRPWSNVGFLKTLAYWEMVMLVQNWGKVLY